ncbi:PREDICTED: transmembrane and coiled-coil domains protein 1-like [Tauraco erythrolophus]|uniref:transmembrane and coiled-coil domains protein 1-like n=1 Tax=Tauraco erythrolophus TaxID=121530 RepID=UPI000523911A|nr:PREDICTED: transmembrane and coiled-coil domains protein 1-like [Tauraco erythrolophus]
MEPAGTEQLCDDPDPGGKSQDQETKKQHESEQKLSKITHNALENINVIGQGLKHLFQHQRRRSSVSPHDVQQAQADLEPELDLESQSVCADIDGVSTHPTALNRVLQQIRVPPKMKRGTSLHSRRGKADAPKGSPQINRRSAQDIQSGRPRSSSTTDAPTNLSVMEIVSSVCVGGEEATAAAVMVDWGRIRAPRSSGGCLTLPLRQLEINVKIIKLRHFLCSSPYTSICCFSDEEVGGAEERYPWYRDTPARALIAVKGFDRKRHWRWLVPVRQLQTASRCLSRSCGTGSSITTAGATVAPRKPNRTQPELFVRRFQFGAGRFRSSVSVDGGSRDFSENGRRDTVLDPSWRWSGWSN